MCKILFIIFPEENSTFHFIAKSVVDYGHKAKITEDLIFGWEKYRLVYTNKPNDHKFVGSDKIRDITQITLPEILEEINQEVNYA